MRSGVDNKGLKRTISSIMLKVNEILAFRANERHGVVLCKGLSRSFLNDEG